MNIKTYGQRLWEGYMTLACPVYEGQTVESEFANCSAGKQRSGVQGEKPNQQTIGAVTIKDIKITFHKSLCLSSNIPLIELFISLPTE
jgi:hypothetical protein